MGANVPEPRQSLNTCKDGPKIESGRTRYRGTGHVSSGKRERILSPQKVLAGYEIQLSRYIGDGNVKWSCKDCGYKREYYMVWDDVWLQSGLGFGGGQLCFNCLEIHIGRKVTDGDLIPWVPINIPILTVGLEVYRHE